MMWSRRRNRTRAAAAHGLDRITEAELGYRTRALGDIAARNILVVSHLGLVRRMATAFAIRGANFDDLAQEGALGLLRATRTFEPERSIRFATYAAYWVRSYMQRHLASIRSHQYGAPASVAYSGGQSRGRAGPRRLLRTASLDAPTSAHSDQPLGDCLACDNRTPEESVERLESRDRVRAALITAFDELDDKRVAVVIKKRLLSDDPTTLSEIGGELHLSSEGARLLELRVLKRVEAAISDRTA